MQNNTSGLIPDCMEDLGDNRYRCTKHGFVLNNPVLPIKCTLCDPPSLLEQGKNFAKSLVRHTLDGFKKVPTEELRRRLDICNKCEHRQGMRCMKCGCFLNIKASWESEDCPIGLWSPSGV